MTAIRLAPLVLAASLPWQAGAESELVGRCTGLASTLVQSLSGDARALSSFAGAEREQWSYRPGSVWRKTGLTLAEMTDQQRLLTHRLMRCALSAEGYAKAAGIMQLDELVAELTADFARAMNSRVEIGQDYYWLSVFGEPRGDQPWGWQFEGHHLALNFTVVDDRLSFTPAFLGAEPAEVQSGSLAGWRLLEGEEELAFALLASLNEQQRGQAILADTVADSLFAGPGRGDALQDFEGLAASQMTPAQRALLWELIEQYAGNMDRELAAVLLENIAQDGPQTLHFAWIGPGSRGAAIYYRVHGPSILIEFDHATDFRSPERAPDPNHIHSLMRVPDADFGEDLLARHYRESPHHRGEPQPD